MIAIGTLNIQDGQGFGLAQAIQEVECRGFDVMLPTDKNIQLKAYLHSRLGYNVICSATRLSSARGAQGGVGWRQGRGPSGGGLSTHYTTGRMG